MEMTAATVLKKYFGFDAFRLHQEVVIENTLAGEDSLVIMPTGGGKSICYQVPALMLPGVTIVVSPLIALMKDQVDALKANGKIYFLDRPLENLIPTVSRPLTSTLADLNEKYRERYPLYLDAADKKIAARGAPDKIAQQILKEHESTSTGKHFV